MSAAEPTRLKLSARVVNRNQELVGQLREVVVERQSRRIAGLLIISDEVAPREIFVLVGQVEHFSPEQIALNLSDEEFVALPDAYQQLFVAADQDLDEEIAAAEAPTASANIPDPAEQPVPTALPGIALTPNLLIPIAVERSIMDDEQLALRDGMQLLTGDGAEIGQLTALLIDTNARVTDLILNDHPSDLVDYQLVDHAEDNNNLLILRPNDPTAPARA